MTSRFRGAPTTPSPELHPHPDPHLSGFSHISCAPSGISNPAAGRHLLCHSWMTGASGSRSRHNPGTWCPTTHLVCAMHLHPRPPVGRVGVCQAPASVALCFDQGPHGLSPAGDIPPTGTPHPPADTRSPHPGRVWELTGPCWPALQSLTPPSLSLSSQKAAPSCPAGLRYAEAQPFHSLPLMVLGGQSLLSHHSLDPLPVPSILIVYGEPQWRARNR